MPKMLPKWFRTLFVVGMLLTVVMVCVSLWQGADQDAQIRELEVKLEANAARLRKQEAELRAAQEKLPEVREALVTALPAAEAAEAAEDALRAERKRLRGDKKELEALNGTQREELAALEKKLAALEQGGDAEGGDLTQLKQTLQVLQEQLEQLLTEQPETEKMVLVTAE